MGRRKSPPSFYVYVFFRPWDGTPFYVGKGKGDRWKRHLRRDRCGNNEFNKILLKARTLKAAVPHVKMREGLSEVEALALERLLIGVIGRMNINTGPLVNRVQGGGEGSTGLIWTDKMRERARLSALRRPYLTRFGHKRSAETKAKLSVIAANRTGTFLGKRHTDETKRLISATKKRQSGNDLLDLPAFLDRRGV